MSGENKRAGSGKMVETQDVVTTGIDFGTGEMTVFSMRDPVPVHAPVGVTSKRPVRYVPYPGWRWVERDDGLMHHEPIDAALDEPAP